MEHTCHDHATPESSEWRRFGTDGTVGHGVSGDNLLHHVSIDIRKPAIAPDVPPHELLAVMECSSAPNWPRAFGVQSHSRFRKRRCTGDARIAAPAAQGVIQWVSKSWLPAKAERRVTAARLWSAAARRRFGFA